MSQATPDSTPQFKGKLSRTMLLLIIPIALLPIIIIGSIAYIGAQDLLESQSYDQLSTIEKNAENQINSWISEKHIFLHNLVRNDQFSSSIKNLFSLHSQNAEYDSVGEEIVTKLTEENDQNSQVNFNYFVVVDQTGEIIASSIADWVGETIEDEQFFSSLTTKATRSKIVYRLNPFSDNVIVLSAEAIRDEDNTYLGSVIGVTRGDSLRVFLQTAEIYPESQAYFINADQKYFGVTKLLQTIARLEPSENQKQVLGKELTGCLESSECSFKAKYRSFDSEPVLGSFFWMPEINSGLVIEIPISAVYARLNNLVPIALGLLLVFTLLLVFLIRFGASRIVNPIIQAANTAKNIAQGDWRTRLPATRNDEIGLLAHSFNEMADQLSKFYRSLEAEVQERTDQIYAISEIEHKISSASTVKELFNTTVQTIKQNFDFLHVSLYELNPSGLSVTLRSLAGRRLSTMLIDLYTLNAEKHTAIHTAITTAKPSTTSQEEKDLRLEQGHLPETQSAAIIPLFSQEEIFGLLSIESKNPRTFSKSMLTALETIAEQFTITLQRIRSLEITEESLVEKDILYQASQRIIQTKKRDEIETIIIDALAKVSFISSVFDVEDENLQVKSVVDPQNKRLALPIEWLAVSREELEGLFPNTLSYRFIKGQAQKEQIPSELLAIPQDLNCQELAFLPIWEEDQLSTLILLGSREENSLTAASIQPYINLVEMAKTILEKMAAMKTINQQLAELRMLQRIGQSVSKETTLNKLFPVLHEEIKQTLGDVSFLISIYDKEKQEIRIPYMYTKGSGVSSIPPFPLGEGLTSIVIRTKQPLMLVENTLARSKALGAKIVGVPANSWLGVPLLAREEPIGTITVQDAEHENAFTEDDMKLLSTIAAQISIAIRNILTLETIHSRAQQQEQLLKAASAIRSSTDMKTILATTTKEVTNLLNIKSASIEITPSQEMESEQTEASL